MAVDLGYAIGLEPEKAVAYFESKGYKLGFRWQDVAAEAHAKAFTVAGVMKVDVLQDIRQALATSLKKGTTFDEFKRQLSPVLEKKGWLGQGMIVDQDTGEIEGKRLTPRRLQTIFQTNMQSAYMAGRYAAQLEQVDTHPYWEYVAVLDSRTRPAHRALAGRIYRYDDPFWQTFYPPNGYRCRCRVRTRTRAWVEDKHGAVYDSSGHLVQVEIVDRSGTKRPALAYQDPVTGQKLLPDPGFSSNPGAQWAKPFTPPPMDSLPKTLPSGAALPPPSPARVRPDAIMPAGLPPEQYAQGFMRQFGAALGKPATFTDVAGEAVQVNSSLFQDGVGRWASSAVEDGRFIQLLADAVKEPDEIWLSWAQLDGAWSLRRRYLRTLETEAGDWGVAVFDQGQDGWAGNVTFPADVGTSDEERRAYLDTLRGTFLRYCRPQGA
ncbi:TPA: minor capsid protein [Burkholderia vietnamiensis]|uniref:phage minor head protein n=1 Tax=Burkholderia vietnamiensis TaxID=60552 RepID=UPI001593E0AF|nr:phage minor head protein [Burkholderia vietnamiensis]MBR7910107.1 minor capsid protein [Burkholderia vietnamiensis]HDR9102983.1 minor capsid protein [Burkholderia vietnamiensis]HDR9274153.1 minor capsid protein [Burkholderia vietnamiensis]